VEWIRSALAALAESHRIRTPPVLDDDSDRRPDGRSIVVDGVRYVSFASNDYLGLGVSPRVAAAAADAAVRYGTGAGASRLIVGTSKLHRELERRIAAFKGTEDAVLFSTGYQAGVGAVGALAGASDAVLLDKLSHACLVDGARMSGARVRSYPHLKVARLVELLEREAGARRRLVVTDSLFSMDGDCAPVDAIVDAAERFDAMVLVDEAHATGTTGPGGRGVVAMLGISSERLVQMGTLSKALGSLGGFVAASTDVCTLMRNTSRSYIYTTAPPPAAVAAALEALTIVEREPELLERLTANVRLLGELAPRLSVQSPIVPVVVGSEERAVECQRLLRERGIWVSAVRPPTVPRGQSRLRISISAAHAREDIERLAAALADPAIVTEGLA
jgi:8-amino-7-oxononanoate synthase